MKKFFKRLWDGARKAVKSPKMKTAGRVAMIACLMLAVTTDMFASATGAFSTAATQLSSYRDGIRSIIMAVGVLVGLVGAGRIYFKYQAGDQDLMKSMIQWGGSFVFIMVAAQAIPAMLGL